MSQEKLGLEAGLDPMSASARMNRYENGKRSPDFALATKLAAILGVPTPYLYTEDDEFAGLLLALAQLDLMTQRRLKKLVEAKQI